MLSPRRPLPTALAALLLLTACGIGGRRSGNGEGEGEGEGPTEGEGEGPAEGEGEGPAEGEGEGPTEGEGEGPAEGEGEGGGDVDAGFPDGGPPAVDAGPRPADLVGVVNVTQVRVMGDAYRGNGGAFFDESGEPPHVDGCQLVPGDEAPEQESYHAGVLRVAGGRRELVLTPEPGGRGRWVYRSNLPESNDDLFDEGNRLVFTGDGGPHAGAFGAEVVAPKRIEIDRPTPFPQPREGDAVDVRWNVDDTDGVLVTVTSSTGFPPRGVAGPSILCFGPDDGSESVPANLMAQLPDGDGFILGVARIRLREVEVDAHTRVVLTVAMAGGSVLNYAR